MAFLKYNPLERNAPTQKTATDPTDADSGVMVTPAIGDTGFTLTSPSQPSYKTGTAAARFLAYLSHVTSQDMGITFYESSGHLGLRFNPGLNANDCSHMSKRAKIAAHLYDMLIDAHQELKTMIAQGTEIPLLKKD